MYAFRVEGDGKGFQFQVGVLEYPLVRFGGLDGEGFKAELQSAFIELLIPQDGFFGSGDQLHQMLELKQLLLLHQVAYSLVGVDQTPLVEGASCDLVLVEKLLVVVVRE